jgi:hypothetical protein
VRERQRLASSCKPLVLLKRERLDLTAGKLGKEELDGREIGPLVLVQLESGR